MGPRKRSKPNPQAGTESRPTAKSQGPISQAREDLETPSEGPLQLNQFVKAKSSKLATDEASTPQPAKSWYGGSWSRGNKATPITQVAKETITATSGAASDAVASALRPQTPTTPLKSPTVYLSRSIGSSSRSLPLAAATTKLNITSSITSSVDERIRDAHPVKPVEVARDQKSRVDHKSDSSLESREGPASDASIRESLVAESNDKPSEEAKSNQDSVGWLKWFSKPEPSQNGPDVVSTSNVNDMGAKDPRLPSCQDTDAKLNPGGHSAQRRNSYPGPISPKNQQQQSSRSWLSLWGNAATQSQDTASASATAIATNGPENSENPLSQKKDSNLAQTASISDHQTPEQPDTTRRSYGWALWPRDQSKDGKVEKSTQVECMPQTSFETAIDGPRSLTNRQLGKGQRPQSLPPTEVPVGLQSIDDDGKDESKVEPRLAALEKDPDVEIDLKAKRMPENLLLPLFNQTYNVIERPSLMQQLGRLLQSSPLPRPKHVGLSQGSNRIERALSIGVHGYFPAPFIRSVLGQPTGTSIRFANSAASAIHKWTRNQGYSCEVEKVALEGEGKIAERVDLLWKLMLNWIEKIRKADFVMIACHSQGVPVAMMLVAKLIAFGCVNSTRIGVCAMAGVNLGPFSEYYKSRWISGSAGELFDFAYPDSQVSKDYEAALDVGLKFGVKIVYVGSIDDQLVSLESSTFGSADHPHLYRAVFVDGRVHAPDFLTHLVGFSLKLRNLGISDHGLIRELSTPLAGSLYGGEGHSRIYDDEAVYYLAVQHALETTSLGSIPLQISRVKPATTTSNPYILPFAMRGLLEEDYVRTELSGETSELIKQFDDWKPTSKVLKDVKFRLEGVRSKL